MAELVEALAGRVRGEVRAQERLAEHTTLKVGGPAAAFVTAEDAADVAAVAEVCTERGVPWLLLGRGSNLLVADAGWPGVVVKLGRGFKGVVAEHPDGGVVDDPEALPVGTEVAVVAGGAESMPVLANKVARLGLGGLAFGVAIPGSLGGAVRMNAGAHGGEMRDILEWADAARLGDGGRVERFPAADLQMRYRHTDLPADALVVRARLRLRRERGTDLDAAMKEMKAWRRAHQPIGEPSCGSVFRNPDGDSAGRLVESAGLKGLRVGGAQVSQVHANFITVDPGASAGDVHSVIRQVQARVAQQHGVDLQTEVVLAGFDDDGSTAGAP